MPKLKQNQFYCVVCNQRVTLPEDEICVKVFRNPRMDGGTPALVGYHERCDSNLTKFIKHNSVDRMINKYGKC